MTKRLLKAIGLTFYVWYDEGDLRPLTKRERGPVVQRRK